MHPPLLQLEAPITVCGDILGQCQDLLSIFDAGGYPPDTSYLFLGNYVNKGKFSLDTITLLFAYKVKYPDKLFLLRGHQESAHMTRIHGFYDEMLRWYGVKLWKRFCRAFDCLPICAIVDSKVFCVHGGLSPDLADLRQLERIERPTEVPERGLLCDLLWSDPAHGVTGWKDDDRSRSYVFGADVVQGFLCRHDFMLMCRGHGLGLASGEGIEFFGERVITICSAPNAYYMCDRDAKGALVQLNKDLSYSFNFLSW
jgi:serine/threonine-protein phosphatase PP1 catalytic subunit